MGDIYEDATVTIMAVSAKSASDGFLQDRPETEPYFRIPFWTPNDSIRSIQLHKRGAFNFDIDNEFIETRG